MGALEVRWAGASDVDEIALPQRHSIQLVGIEKSNVVQRRRGECWQTGPLWRQKRDRSHTDLCYRPLSAVGRSPSAGRAEPTHLRRESMNDLLSAVGRTRAV
jgi:hypothetical protein